MSSHEEDLAREICTHNEGITEPPGDFADDETPTRPGADRRRYILIVEDDVDVRDVVDDLLKGSGYRTKIAANGAEALGVLDQEYMVSQYVGQPGVPSMILLDLMMPVKNGWDFYAELRRSRPMFDNVPVLIMSADSRVTAFSKWCIDVAGIVEPRDGLAKPFSAAELLRKVRCAMGRNDG